jgi:hypothetical protein
MEYAELPVPVLVSSLREPVSGEQVLDRLGGQQTSPPSPLRIISLRGSDVTGLAFGRVDLQSCHFVDVHNLDKLRIEHPDVFGRAPSRWGESTRQVLAEEVEWRHTMPRSGHWKQIMVSPLPEAKAPLQPRSIAALYRALRKGREDSKDEPGAADFYYGEMEMRRYGTRWPSVERLLLTLYWLVSGYALRAWRAFVALALVIVGAAVLFAGPGFKPATFPTCGIAETSQTGTPVYRCQPKRSTSYWSQFPNAVVYSAQSATSILRGPDRPLTPLGEYTQIVLRLLGPLLFGLAILSLRGRVKR